MTLQLSLEKQFTLQQINQAIDGMSLDQLVDYTKELAKLHLCYTETTKRLLMQKLSGDFDAAVNEILEKNNDGVK